MGLPNLIADRMLQTMNLVHRTVLTISGGRLGATMGNMPVFEVTTTGRTSGKPRTVMLTSPLQRGEELVFVASKGGDDRDPDWYRNMVATPEFTARPVDGGDSVELIARTASADEKAELWPEIVAAYRGYGGYQSRTDRDIPVVIAEPVAG